MKTKLVIIATASLLALGGCKKDFLDKNPSETTSTDQLGEAAERDPTIIDGYIAGVYATMYQNFTAGVKDANRHDDFGQKGYDIYMDMLSGDMALTGVNYNWYSGLARLNTPVDFTQPEVALPWSYYYRVIYATNTILDLYEGEDIAEMDDVSKSRVGQTLALRAYAYFYLSNIYSREGYGTGSEKTLPIYKSAKITVNQPKSTSKEVFDLIVADLEQAIVYLKGYNRNTKQQINEFVAKGLLSYVLAERGTQADLVEAAKLTDDIIKNGGFSITSKTDVVAQLDANGRNTASGAGFNNVASPSWMWGADLTLASKLDLVSWWGQVDLYTYSYAYAGDPKVIDIGLYNKIPNDDVRKNQFDKENDYMPSNKFFAPERSEGGQRYITTDYLYMRVDEFYLLNAELNARLGNEGAARTSLKALLSERLPSVAYVDNLSGNALKDEIYLQTRIELWGEGKTYLALKRNKKSVTRGANHLFEVGVTFNYNDPKLSFVIPQAEVINNPNLNK